MTYPCKYSNIPVCVGEGGVVTVEGSKVGGVPGRPTMGEEGETTAGRKRYAKQMPIKNNSKLHLTIPPTQFNNELCFEYRNVHSYETNLYTHARNVVRTCMSWCGLVRGCGLSSRYLWKSNNRGGG